MMASNHTNPRTRARAFLLLSRSERLVPLSSPGQRIENTPIKSPSIDKDYDDEESEDWRSNNENMALEKQLAVSCGDEEEDGSTRTTTNFPCDDSASIISFCDPFDHYEEQLSISSFAEASSFDICLCSEADVQVILLLSARLFPTPPEQAPPQKIRLISNDSFYNRKDEQKVESKLNSATNIENGAQEAIINSSAWREKESYCCGRRGGGDYLLNYLRLDHPPPRKRPKPNSSDSTNNEDPEIIVIRDDSDDDDDDILVIDDTCYGSVGGGDDSDSCISSINSSESGNDYDDSPTGSAGEPTDIVKLPTVTGDDGNVPTESHNNGISSSRTASSIVDDWISDGNLIPFASESSSVPHPIVQPSIVRTVQTPTACEKVMGADIAARRLREQSSPITPSKEIASIPAPEPEFKGLTGWVRKEFLRTVGATKGSTDKYWISPKTKKRLRSMAEVRRFLVHLKNTNGNEHRAKQLLKGKEPPPSLPSYQ
jgi:hypothetical protein